MELKRVNVAVVGCGGIAFEAHLPNTQLIPKIKLEALVDPCAKALQRAAEKFNVPPDSRFDDLRGVFDRKDIQAVILCTPAATHADLACQCFAAGKHVFVEKPIATTVADACRMIDAARLADKQLMVGHYLRYMPHHMKVRELIQSGKIGSAFSAVAHEETLGIKPEEGIVTDLAPHYIDLLCFYFSGIRVDSVWARTGRANARSGDLETEAEISMFFANGVMGKVNVYWTPGFGNWDACDRHIRVVGSKGWIKTGMTSSAMQVYFSGNLINRMRGPFEFAPKFVLHPDMPIKGTSFRKELEDFAESAIENKPSPIGGEVAIETVKILEAALESARSGAKVEVKP